MNCLDANQEFRSVELACTVTKADFARILIFDLDRGSVRYYIAILISYHVFTLLKGSLPEAAWLELLKSISSC